MNRLSAVKVLEISVKLADAVNSVGGFTKGREKYNKELKEAKLFAIDTLKRIEVGAIAGLVCSKFGEQSMKGNPVPVDFDYNGLANNIVTYLTEGK